MGGTLWHIEHYAIPGTCCSCSAVNLTNKSSVDHRNYLVCFMHVTYMCSSSIVEGRDGPEGSFPLNKIL